MRYRYLTLLPLFLLLIAQPLGAAVISPATVTPGEESATTPATPLTEEEALAIAREYRESIKAMSAKERRELRREKRRAVKEALRDYQDSGTSTLLLVILTIIFPPLGVLVYEGEITSRFWIALLLTLLFYIPGLVYALLTIFG